MKIEILDDFADMIHSFDKEMAPYVVLEALKWASEKPQEALKVVEGWKKLKARGRNDLQWRLSIGCVNPAEALDYAAKNEAKNREQQSALMKVVSQAKKEGYEFTMPNNVHCKIQLKEGEYRFIFTVAGEEITLFYSSMKYELVEQATKYSNVSTRNLYTIVYNGKIYDTSSQAGKALIQAIEQNINPKIVAVISSP